MIKKLLPLLLIAFIACEKTDYIKRSDIETENGFIKGTLSGVYKDSIVIDEQFNLIYSEPENNRSWVIDDFTEIHLYRQSSLIDNNECMIHVAIKVRRTESGDKLAYFSTDLFKKIAGNRIVDIHMSNYEALELSNYGSLEMTNFEFDENTKKASGEIKGTIMRIYPHESNGEWLKEPYDIELEFNVTVWEIV